MICGRCSRDVLFLIAVWIPDSNFQKNKTMVAKSICAKCVKELSDKS